MRNILDASSIRETRTKTGNLFAQACLALYIQRCIYLKNKTNAKSKSFLCNWWKCQEKGNVLKM